MCGKAYLKERLAERVMLDVKTLPYDSTILEFLEKERTEGREIILATASHRIYAERISDYLGVFDRVIATEAGVNLSRHNKSDALVREFGKQGFDYAGNSAADLPVWSVARRAYIVNPEYGVVARARGNGNVEQVLRSKEGGLGVWVKALRLHQWMKNLLIFVPLLASHKVGDSDLLLNAILAFICFGLCASSVYLLNDLLDLPDDRLHPTKRYRPFASGALSIKFGILGIPALLTLAFSSVLWLLPWRVSIVMGLYYVLTLAYSLFIKRISILDVILLSILYTLRIVVGTFACHLQLTFWMLVFSMFIFLSLALSKRYTELREVQSEEDNQKCRGRGYYPGDLQMISSLGAAAGYLSVLVLALYTQERSTTMLYRHPQVIWLACPILLFWISRTWMLTQRGEIHEDPVLFAVKDRVSLVLGCVLGVIFWFAA
jgi:4-hydroxybenzoate polyprenyltransferase